MADQALKEQLLKHLKGGEAFMPVSELLEKISFKKSGKRPVGLPFPFMRSSIIWCMPRKIF